MLKEVEIEREIRFGKYWEYTYTLYIKVTRDGHVYARKLKEDWREQTSALGRPACVLILETFKGPKPSPEYECCHRDDDRSNNHIDNLYWGTHAENMKDASRNGKMTVREGRRPILNEDDKLQAKELYATGNYTLRDIADMFSVGTMTIQRLTK